MMKTVTHRFAGSLRWFAIVAASLYLLTACGGGGGTGPEEQLRAWVSAGVAAAEAKQRRALLDMVSPAYTDARGNDRDEIGNMLRIYFLRQNNIKLLTSIEEIRVIADTAAELTMTVGMAGTNDGTFGFSADAYRFAFELERGDDEWQLISARWGELGEELR